MTLSISPLQKTVKELICVCANILLNSIQPLLCWKKDCDIVKFQQSVLQVGSVT